jgi:hypothetical protein
MVVSKAGTTLQYGGVTARSFTTSINSRTCKVAEGTPLAVLKASGVSFHLKDFAKCSTNPVASAGLFVDRIGTTTNTGISGWSFKVNNRAGTAGAADTSGPFGTGHLAGGEKVVWFWCVYDANWACQRSLSVTAPATAASGSTVTVSVAAYDDAGASVPASRVKVTVGKATATTGTDGNARLKVPSTGASAAVHAVDGIAASRSYTQRVQAFPVSIKLS